MEKDEFYLRVARSLSGCQLVEEGLKLYITEALQLVEKCLDKKMPFKMRGQDYENSSLERLIEAFKKLSDQPALVAALNKFKDDRNFLSHQAITHCLDGGGDYSDAAAAGLEPRLKAIELEAESLRLAIHDALNLVRVNEFDDLGPLESSPGVGGTSA
jgi:hypothetical protein